jgi:hypothetical protein
MEPQDIIKKVSEDSIERARQEQIVECEQVREYISREAGEVEPERAIAYVRMSGFHEMLNSNISNEDLGALIKEYIEESDHGSWEGFDMLELLGISALLRDIALYREFSLKG